MLKQDLTDDENMSKCLHRPEVDVDLSKIDKKHAVGHVEHLSIVCRAFDQSISKPSVRQRARRKTFFNQGIRLNPEF